MDFGIHSSLILDMFKNYLHLGVFLCLDTVKQ